MDETQIQAVRRFNRAVTRRIGALSGDYLGRGRPLAASRLLFEIGHGGADLRDLRARLGLDSGYLSRLLRALEREGLLRTRAAADDARVRVAQLSAKGRREVDTLEQRSQALAASLLAPLSPAQRTRMVNAMHEVERLLRAATVQIAAVDPAGAAAQACIAAYLAELDQRFEGGFDARRSVSADPAELLPPNGVFLLASLDGEGIGCGGLKRTAPGIGEIKRMWVAPAARGLGIAQRLLDTLEAQARDSGLHTLRLDTNRSLVEARALYARNGYLEIADYNGNPYADHWYQKRLGAAG